jgi:hypothetical protein
MQSESITLVGILCRKAKTEYIQNMTLVRDLVASFDVQVEVFWVEDIGYFYRRKVGDY